MKTIFNVLITAVFCTTLISATQTSSENVKNYLLQSTGNNVTSASLAQSADIISARLKAYGLNGVEVTTLTDKGQVSVQLPDNVELSEIEGLMTSRGELAFYETLNSNNFAELLKINKGGKPLLVRSDVESINSSIDEGSQNLVTRIKFKPAATSVWADATKRNLNKPIAIAVDNQVFYTPTVKVVIESGLCEISGNFSQKEVRYFLALVNNGPLSINFTLLK